MFVVFRVPVVSVTLLCFFATAQLASAQTTNTTPQPGRQPAPNSQPSVPPGPDALPSPADMMARIHLLEKRLADVEDRKRAGAAKSSPKAPAALPPTSGRTTSGEPSAPAMPPAVAEPPNTTTVPQSTPAPAKSTGTAAANPAELNATSLQSSFLFRDQAPTLASNKTEVSFEGNYTRNVRAGASPVIQYDRVFSGTLDARFGIGNGFEIGAAVPYFQSTRQTRGPVNVNDDIDSIGDVRLQVAKQLFAPTALLPGLAMSFGVEAPTGATRYGDIRRVVAIQETATSNCLTLPGGCVADPRDQTPFSPFLPPVASRGHWAGSANAQFFKSFDPIVIFFGAGVTYAAPRDFEGDTFQPGLRIAYNAGISLALSEHTTLGFQYNGTFEQPFKAIIRGYSDGRTRTFTEPSQESARARMVIIQRMAKDLYLEPSLTYGLTDDTPDLTLGIALRKRM